MKKMAYYKFFKIIFKVVETALNRETILNRVKYY